MTEWPVHSPVARLVAAARAQQLTHRQQQVLTMLRLHPEGLTDEEGAQLMGDGTTREVFGRHRHHLHTKELVVDTGMHRLTSTHTRSIVWKAAK